MDASPPPPRRMGPLGEGEPTGRQQEVIDDLVIGPTVNIYRTIARHPDAATAMVNLGRTLRGGRLSARHREILILRTGWNCRSAYEFAQHRRIALAAGMALDEIGRLQKDPDTAGWDDPFDVTLVRAADELHDDAGLTDATWQALAARYDDEELIETIMLVGYYHLVSFVLNSLGVPLEPGAESFLDG